MIKVNKDALFEYERLSQNDLFSKMKRNIVSDNAVLVLAHNVRSVSKHLDYNKVIDNEIIAFYRKTNQFVRFYLLNNQYVDFFSMLILIMKINLALKV